MKIECFGNFPILGCFLLIFSQCGKINQGDCEVRCYSVWKGQYGFGDDILLLHHCDTLNHPFPIGQIQKDWQFIYIADSLLEVFIDNNKNSTIASKDSNYELSIDTIYFQHEEKYFQTRLLVRGEFGHHLIHLNGIGAIYLEADYRTFITLDSIMQFRSGMLSKKNIFNIEVENAKKLLDY